MPMEWAATSATPNAVVSFVFDRTTREKKVEIRKIFIMTILAKKSIYYDRYEISTVSVIVVIRKWNITYELVIHWDQLVTA